MSKADTPIVKGRPIIGVSTLLPKDAREALIAASKQGNIILDNVLDQIKRKYPFHFQPEVFTEE